MITICDPNTKKAMHAFACLQEQVESLRHSQPLVFEVQAPNLFCLLPPVLQLMSGHGLSRKAWDIAFGIYVQAKAQAKPALYFCLRQGASSLELCREVIERRFLAEDVEVINSIVDMKGIWLQLGTQIQKFLVEYRLNEWIDSMNVNTGLAPSYEDVFDKYKELRQEMNMTLVNYAAYKDRKKWVARFMKKWNASRRALCTHEAENEQAVNTKATMRTPKPHPKPTFVVPVLGVEFGTPNWGPHIESKCG